MPGMTKAGYVPPAPEKQPKPPKEKKKLKGKALKKKRRRMSPAAVASLVMFALAFVIAVGTLHVFASVEKAADVFALGQMLSGHPLGGMTAEEGAALLDKLTQDVGTWRYDIECQGRTYALTAEDVGLFIDRQATLKPLWQVGKTGNMLEKYIALLKARTERNNVEPVFGYTMEPVDMLLAQIKTDTDCESVDATVSFMPGSSEPFRFTDEAIGYTLDTKSLRTQIEKAILSLASGSASAVPEEKQPAVTRAALESAITLRGHVRMTLDDDPASLENVRIAAGVLNGQRIEAESRFSFNEAVGKRTAEGGYQQAAEPAYGIGAVGVGGGVCQVSTALYRAALLGGVEVEQRSAAVRPVAYCDMGQEAAVSDQGIDLVVKNPGKTPIFIVTRVYEVEDGHSMLEMQLIGAPMEARYALVSSPLETEMITEPVYMQDKTGQYAAYTDERVPGSEAQPGYAVVVERVTLGENGEQLSAEVISEDTYEALAPVIYVGIQERD